MILVKVVVAHITLMQSLLKQFYMLFDLNILRKVFIQKINTSKCSYCMNNGLMEKVHSEEGEGAHLSARTPNGTFLRWWLYVA